MDGVPAWQAPGGLRATPWTGMLVAALLSCASAFAVVAADMWLLARALSSPCPPDISPCIESPIPGLIGFGLLALGAVTVVWAIVLGLLLQRHRASAVENMAMAQIIAASVAAAFSVSWTFFNMEAGLLHTLPAAACIATGAWILREMLQRTNAHGWSDPERPLPHESPSWRSFWDGQWLAADGFLRLGAAVAALLFGWCLVVWSLDLASMPWWNAIPSLPMFGVFGFGVAAVLLARGRSAPRNALIAALALGALLASSGFSGFSLEAVARHGALFWFSYVFASGAIVVLLAVHLRRERVLARG